jgi:hypothetical protein
MDVLLFDEPQNMSGNACFCRAGGREGRRFRNGAMYCLSGESLGGRPTLVEGLHQPRKFSVQQQASLVRGLGLAGKRGPWLKARWRRQQLPQPQVAGIGLATAGTQEAALLDSLVEQDLHGRFLLA